MIDFVARMPGWVLAHPWLFLTLLAVLGAGYLAILAGTLRSQDRADARRADRKYGRSS